jgi:hypothetical protein
MIKFTSCEKIYDGSNFYFIEFAFVTSGQHKEQFGIFEEGRKLHLLSKIAELKIVQIAVEFTQL